MRSHEVDYEIIGDDIQIVEVELDPGEVVIAEAGVMNYMDDGIDFEAKMGDGSKADEGLMGKLLGAAKRKICHYLATGIICTLHRYLPGAGRQRHHLCSQAGKCWPPRLACYPHRNHQRCNHSAKNRRF